MPVSQQPPQVTNQQFSRPPTAQQLAGGQPLPVVQQQLSSQAVVEKKDAQGAPVSNIAAAAPAQFLNSTGMQQPEQQNLATAGGEAQLPQTNPPGQRIVLKDIENGQFFQLTDKQFLQQHVNTGKYEVHIDYPNGESQAPLESKIDEK